jgi:hypothetical protein
VVVNTGRGDKASAGSDAPPAGRPEEISRRTVLASAGTLALLGAAGILPTPAASYTSRADVRRRCRGRARSSNDWRRTLPPPMSTGGAPGRRWRRRR